MVSENQNFTIYGGNDVRLDVTLLDRDGSPLDLTGVTLVWGMSPKRSNDAVLAKTTDDVAEIEITNALEGLATVTILAVDTENLPETGYRHEMKIVDKTGKIETLLTGTLTVRSSILD